MEYHVKSDDEKVKVRIQISVPDSETPAGKQLFRDVWEAVCMYEANKDFAGSTKEIRQEDSL